MVDSTTTYPATSTSTYGIEPGAGMQVGLYTLGDHMPDGMTGERVSAQARVHEIVDHARAAEQAGFDIFTLGESHQEYFVSQAHAVILGAIAQATSTMHVGSSSTILSTSDPVRVYENFATLDLVSDGRAELVAGRASRVGLFELLGYDLRDYEALFEEKLDLLRRIDAQERVTWQGRFRAPLQDASVLPRPVGDHLPIWRAVGGSPGSAIQAGLQGIPMVMAHLAGNTSHFRHTIDAYRQAAVHAGYDPQTLPVATAGPLFVAETTQEALRELYPRVNEGMKLSNGQGMPKQLFAQSADPTSIVNVGSPQQVIEKILHQHEVFGHQRYMAQIDFGGMPRDTVLRQIEIMGEEVIPAVKKYTAGETTTAAAPAQEDAQPAHEQEGTR